MFHSRILREIEIKDFSGKSPRTFILNQYYNSCQVGLGHILEIDISLTFLTPSSSKPIQIHMWEGMSLYTDRFSNSVSCELINSEVHSGEWLNIKSFLRSDS